MSATPRGDLPRNEGHRAFPYGPRTAGHDSTGTFHARKSILAVHEEGAHGVKPYPARNHDAYEGPSPWEVKVHESNRAVLRTLCKERGIRYGKMTVRQMVDALMEVGE